ncbi:Repeat domain-containing protein [Dyadobacter sp. SG02]|nr:Repeat domain-containing protein [Dyadobacter sp. SG02]
MTGICFAQTDSRQTNFGQTFLPDYTFRASSLRSMQTLGEAGWGAANGVITGKPKTAAGGWLVLDSAYQDLGFRALFRCTGGAETGILFRAEKTDKGLKGIYLSLKPGDVAAYRLLLDAQGKEISREKLRPGGGIYYRAAPPAKGDEPARNFPQRPAAPADLPVTRPNTDLRAGEWNQVEVFIEENVIRSFVNDGGEMGGVADGTEALDEYGPVALYVGGTGEVAFRELMFKDIAVRVTPKEKVSEHFSMQRISDMYYSWGADAADFNRDGHLDIVAGPLIYYGPGFTRHREIFTAVAVGPSKEFTSTNVQFTYDFNGDGWPDVLTSPSAAVLFINPKGENRRWKSYNILPSVQSEITHFTDIDRDGVPELVYGAEGYMRYAKFDKNDPGKPWKAYTISGKGYALAHGIGTGDINGDGRIDLLNAYGWWEQPAGPLDEQTQWKYHPVAFGRYGRRGSNIGGSLMAVYDANGDGLADVVTNLNVHGFGLAWYEQKRKPDGSIDFVRHMISDDYSAKSKGGVTFSQAHGATFADVDLDGIPDYIVGKRYFTHLDNMFDPDSYGAPVLYWYRTVRNPKAPGGAEFVPELIHNRSGAGSEITAVDINKDGAVEILTSTNHGTFIFWNKHRKSPSKK